MHGLQRIHVRRVCASAPAQRRQENAHALPGLQRTRRAFGGPAKPKKKSLLARIVGETVKMKLSGIIRR